jgi:hypothetical protein
MNVVLSDHHYAEADRVLAVNINTRRREIALLAKDRDDWKLLALHWKAVAEERAQTIGDAYARARNRANLEVSDAQPEA